MGEILRKMLDFPSDTIIIVILSPVVKLSVLFLFVVDFSS